MKVKLGTVGGHFVIYQFQTSADLLSECKGQLQLEFNNSFTFLILQRNFFIDPRKHTSFDSVVQMIAKTVQGAFIGQQEIKSAFKLLPICPGDFDLLGFLFDDMYCIDKCLPLGCSVSCKVFLPKSLSWLTIKKSHGDTIDHQWTILYLWVTVLLIIRT